MRRHQGGRVARPADKYDERRNQLAESALQTLGELGYARTSLREIANNSEFSHGVVHYYFAGQARADRLLRALLQGAVRDPVRRGGRRLEHRRPSCWTRSRPSWSRRCSDEAPMHRLWYDLRTQSMFEERLRDGVVLDRRDARGDDLAGGRPATPSWPAASRVVDAGRGVRRCSTACSSRRCSAHLSGSATALDDLVGPGARPDAAAARARDESAKVA